MSFNLYIWQVLKMLHPEMGISLDSVSQLDQFSYQLVKYIAHYCVNVNSYASRNDITPENLALILDFIIHGELSKYAISEGARAVTKISSSISILYNSRSKRAGLKLSILKVEIILKDLGICNISDESLAYITSICEYLLAELLELSGNEARAKNSNIIQPKNLIKIVKNDEELSKTFKNLGISFNKEGGNITVTKNIQVNGKQVCNKVFDEKEVEELDKADDVFMEEYTEFMDEHNDDEEENKIKTGKMKNNGKIEENIEKFLNPNKLNNYYAEVERKFEISEDLVILTLDELEQIKKKKSK